MNRAARRAEDRQQPRFYRLAKREGSPARRELNRHRATVAAASKKSTTETAEQ